MLLLCVARPELLEIRSSWGGGKMNATSILLEPLATDDASMLVDNLLGRAKIPSAARARILEAAEGNPLFVEEMLGMLIDDGLLRFEDGAWHGVEDLADLTVPPTIQLLLAARLDRLDAEERSVIERGAVEGKVFHTGAVATLSPERLRANVPSRLLALARKELIRPDRAEFAGEDAFRFRHLLIRDAAYHAMPKEQRADLHERYRRVARARRGRAGRGVRGDPRLPPRAGVPLQDRARPARTIAREALGQAAAERLIRSAERARERGDSTSARPLLQRAADVSEGALRTQALFELSRTLFDIYDFHASAQAAEMAIAAAEESGDRGYALRARLIHVEDLAQLDPSYAIQQTLAESESALAELERLDDAAGIRQAKLAVARTSFYLGNSEACFAIVEELRGDGAGFPFIDRREIVMNIAMSVYFGPTPADEAILMLEQAHELVAGSVVMQAMRSNQRTALLAMRGAAEESDAERHRAEELWDEVGDAGVRLGMGQPMGESQRFLGRPDVAEGLFRAMAEHYSASGETGFNSTVSGLLALTLCDQARFDEAEIHASSSRELAAEDDFASQAVWRMARAQVLSYREGLRRGSGAGGRGRRDHRCDRLPQLAGRGARDPWSHLARRRSGARGERSVHRGAREVRAQRNRSLDPAGACAPQRVEGMTTPLVVPLGRRGRSTGPRAQCTPSTKLGRSIATTRGCRRPCFTMLAYSTGEGAKTAAASSSARSASSSSTATALALSSA